MENKNFQDITHKSYVPLAAGYGIEGAFPVDLRTVLPGFTMLEALIHRNMMYEGLRVYIAGTVYICKPRFHSAVWSSDGDIAASKDKYYLDEELTQPVTDGTASGTTVYSNMLWYEEFQVSSTSSETATQADKLSHNVVINGKTTNFALPTGEDETVIDTGLFTPETIAAGTDIDTITHCGFYSYTDANESANNYSLLIEKIGDKLYRTKISIENGVPVIETSVQVGQSGDTVVWDSWLRFATGKSITTATSQNLHTSSVGGNHVAFDIKIGSTPELWVYSDSSAQYPAGYADIHTADGQVFTIAAQSLAISHPFVVKLKTANDGTRTAAVESLKGDGSNFGMVKLNDAINVDKGVGYGEAATPKAVRSVQANLTNHSGVKGNSSTYGHVKLSDATNSDSAASANIAATPKAVKDAVAAEASARANADTAINNTITDLKNKIRALFGYDVNNVYLATCGTAVQGGDVGFNWANQPTKLNLNDVVVVTFTVNQVTQMGPKTTSTSNGYIYEVNWGSEIAANTTKIFVCTRAASGSTTSTWGQLTIGNTMPSRISSVESRISSAETKLAKIPIGMIVMWSGSNVPTGWQLCDGTNGTPNLRDRFIVGSGNSYNIGATGGSNSNRIKINNLPAHSHIYVGDSNIPPHWIWDSNMNGFIVDQSNQNGIKLYDNYGMEIYMPKGDNDEGVWGSTWKNATGVNWTSASIHSWSANGNGDARLYLSSSTIYDKGSRNKTYGKNTPDTIENRPPYYALAFIMFKG